MMDNINKLVEINNQFYSGLILGLSMGVATSRPGERLEAVAQRADLLMFKPSAITTPPQSTTAERAATASDRDALNIILRLAGVTFYLHHRYWHGHVRPNPRVRHAE
jgi:hypothetical protein